MGYRRYVAEFAFLGFTIVVAVLGFWDLYFGPRAAPQPHHHLHLATTYSWMALLAAQLVLLSRGKWAQHRQLGLAVLIAGPLLAASAALLTVHSARRGLASGEGDFLLINNVVGTVFLCLVLWLAFRLRKKRMVHGAFLMSSLILFQGPAMFFSMMSFVPAFQTLKPDTFEQIGIIGLATQAILVGAMFLRDRRNNWPYLFVFIGTFVGVEVARTVLTRLNAMDAALRVVATPTEMGSFFFTLAVMLPALAALVWPSRRLGAADRAAKAGKTTMT